MSGSRIVALGAGPTEQLGLRKGTVLTLFWSNGFISAKDPKDSSRPFTWTAESLDREIKTTDWWKVLPSTWYSRLAASFQAWAASF